MENYLPLLQSTSLFAGISAGELRPLELLLLYTPIVKTNRMCREETVKCGPAVFS